MKVETLNDAIFALNSMRKHIEDGKREHSPQHNDHWLPRIASAIADLEAERAAPQAAPAVIPQPDWANAPVWAMWWAIDSDNDAFWYESEPRLGRNSWLPPGHEYPLAKGRRWQRDDSWKNDNAWRLTLQPRDAADVQAEGGGE